MEIGTEITFNESDDDLMKDEIVRYRQYGVIINHVDYDDVEQARRDNISSNAWYIVQDECDNTFIISDLHIGEEQPDGTLKNLNGVRHLFDELVNI